MDSVLAESFQKIIFTLKATCFTKKVYDYEPENYSGNFPCSNFNCTISNCPHNLKCDEKRTGFPFELVEPIGEGGFATVYRGKFHQGEAAFKFIPIDLDGYKYDVNSVGIYEFYQQGNINKIKILFFYYFC